MSRIVALVISLGISSGCATAGPAGSGSAVPPTIHASGTSKDGVRPLHTPQPEYPESERESATEARVVVHYEIDEQGLVSRARAEGPAAFRRKVLETMATWRFEPALNEGLPRKSKRVASFQFRVAL